MKNIWNKIVDVLEVIWKYAKCAVKLFFKVFNTKEKLAAILLTIYIWHYLPVSLCIKGEVFSLFFILWVLLLDISEDK